MTAPKNNKFPESRNRALVVAPDGDGTEGEVAGPAWKLAEALAAPFDVILAVPAITQSHHPNFAVVYYNRRNLALLAGDSDIVFVTGKELGLQPSLAGLGATMAADEPPSSGAGDLPDYVTPRLAALREVRQANPELEAMLTRAGFMLLFPEPPPPPATGLARYAGRFRYHLRQGGLRQVLRRGLAALRRKLRRR